MTNKTTEVTVGVFTKEFEMHKPTNPNKHIHTSTRSWTTNVAQRLPHSVNPDVGVCRGVVEGSSLSEALPELVLSNVKTGQLPANVIYLLCL